MTSFSATSAARPRRISVRDGERGSARPRSCARPSPARRFPPCCASASARVAETSPAGIWPPTWMVAPRPSQSRGSRRSLPTSISRMTLPAPVASHADPPRRTTATGRSGATLTTSVLGKARSTETPATPGRARTLPLDLVDIDADEARSPEVARDPLDLTRQARRRSANIDLVDGEQRRRVCEPVRKCDADDERSGDEQRTAGRDEADEIEASTGRSSRKRDDDACRSGMPTRSALASSPDHAAWIRRGREASYVCAGSSGSPMKTTSRSSSTPNSSCARRRASIINPTQSALDAPPAFSMKFACFGEIIALPMR